MDNTNARDTGESIRERGRMGLGDINGLLRIVARAGIAGNNQESSFVIFIRLYHIKTSLLLPLSLLFLFSFPSFPFPLSLSHNDLFVCCVIYISFPLLSAILAK